MGGFVSEKDPAYRSQLQGWRFYFNSFTKRGKLNYIMASIAGYTSLYLIIKMFRGKKQPIEQPK